MPTLSPEELERRRPVWAALSELFLDTETRWYVPRISAVLLQSGLSVKELESIWRRELSPECSWNLLQVAGEWADLSLDEQALIRRAEGEQPLLDLPSRLLARMVDEQFVQVLALRARMESIEPGAREACTGAWTNLTHAYFEEKLQDVLLLDHHVASLRATGLPAATLLGSFEQDLRPVLRALLIGRERRSEEQRAANVRAMIELAVGSTQA